MSSYDPTKIYDGHVELIGVNGHTRPLRLPRNLVHRAINCQFRGDEPKPRPGWRGVPLTYSSGLVQSDINGGRFQGSGVYTADDGTSFKLMLKGGRLFKITADGDVSDISIKDEVVVLADWVAPGIGSSVTVDVSDASIFIPGDTVRHEGYQYEVIGSSSGKTDLTVAFAVPAIGATVVATVTDTTGFVAGRTIQIDKARYIVDTIGGPTSITLENVDDVAVTRAIGEFLVYHFLTVTNVDDIPGDPHTAGEKFEVADLNASLTDRAWYVQAEKWAVFQDGIKRPIIFDGASARRAGYLEIPTGTVMAYGWGRIWVAVNNGKQFVAGDLLYGPTGTAEERRRDSILKFTENTYIAEGGAFQIPENRGQITAMGFLSVLDNSLGQGPLQIFTTVGGFTVNASIPRDDWKTVNSDNVPIVAVSLKERGCEGDRYLFPVNSDFYYRSGDGVRSFQLSRREFGTWWNTPISKEVGWVLDLDPQPLLAYGSGIYFGKRYLCTCGPQQSTRGIIHKGVVALDLEQQSWLTQESPQWDGLWTCAPAYQILTGKYSGKDRAFALCENGEGNFELYEITEDDHEDLAANMTDPTRIRWAIEFSTLTFPRGEVGGLHDLKELHGGEMHASDLENEVEFKLRFRPDGYPCWVVWHWWTKCATMGACESSLEYCPTWDMGQPQDVGPMGIPKPPKACDVNNRRLDINYAWQMRLDVRGYCVLKSVRYVATSMPQPTTVKPEPHITEGSL